MTTTKNLTAAHLWLPILLLSVPSSSQTVALDQIVGPVTERVITVSPVEFNQELIASECNRFLREPRSPLSKLILASSQTDALSMRSGKHIHEVYQSWYPSFVDQSRSAGPVAELIVFGSNATLRVQDRSRQITRSVLRGHDALTIDLGGTPFELLDFHSAHLAHPVEGVAPEGLVVDLYFRTSDKLSLGKAKVLTSRMVDRIGIRHGVSVYVRNDTWFIEDPSFPVYYRFSPYEHVPTREEYQTGPQIICVIDHHSEIRCSGHKLEN
jgi:hypothetical protein